MAGDLTTWVDFDPVAAYRGSHNPVRRLGDNGVGLFHRHVAVNAIVCDLIPHFFGDSAALPSMAAQTAI